MAKLMTYQRPIVGYHGCNEAVAEEVLAGRQRLNPSANLYDWLGGGVYFWEHVPQRAYEWAVEQARLTGRKTTRPSVLAAKINLGVCLDLLDTANTRLLAEWYFKFRRVMRRNGITIPKNQDAKGTLRSEKVLRFRDRAVIDFTIQGLVETDGTKYQTVRGVFVEGQPAFPGSKIALKSHLQIAVRDPGCVTEFFRPEVGDYEAV